MISQSIARLEYLCETLPPLLYAADDDLFSAKPLPGKWSRKEILGHLVDSATNNHQRFVRALFEEYELIPYDQENWVKYNHYQQLPLEQLVEFWAAYNRHLVSIWKHLSPENLQRTCSMKDGSTVTVGFLVNDYVVHLEHHLRQIVAYEAAIGG